jgi:predicted dehydrogenase
MKPIKAGIIGMGYIGVSHIEAVRRIGFAELVAVADVNYELAERKAVENNVPRCYRTVDELLADPEIQVVHNCTPNHLHTEINIQIIEAGKHVFSEKPLARSSDESARQIEALAKHPEIVAGLNFNYRMNPLVQEMKQRVRKGEIGRPRLVHGSYLQDWLLFETDYNWRIEPEISGPSRVMADIGSHWMDSVQVVTGTKIVEVCADLLTAFPVRKKPKGQVETFAVNINAEYEDKEVLTEDYGAVLFRMDNGARGVFLASQVSPGRKCHLNFEIDGTIASLYWNQELADQMWMGFRDQDNHLVMRNPNLMDPEARPYTYLAAGHPEGWNDAMRANVYAFYKYVQDGKRLGVDAGDFATFQEGHYLVRLVEAILESNRTRSWVSI